MPTAPRQHRPHSGPAPSAPANRVAGLHDRPDANARGYGAKWQKARTAFLAHHPLCIIHERAGRVVAATVVDHIKPHRGCKVLFWDRANWQPLCETCHNRKTGAGG